MNAHAVNRRSQPRDTNGLLWIAGFLFLPFVLMYWLGKGTWLVWRAFAQRQASGTSPAPAIDNIPPTAASSWPQTAAKLPKGPLIAAAGGIAALCFGGMIVAAIGRAPATKPTVTIASCEIAESGTLRTATIRFVITNNSPARKSFTVEFEVNDAAGSRVGTSSAFVSPVDSGRSASGETTVFLTASGGRTCVVVDQDIHYAVQR